MMVSHCQQLPSVDRGCPSDHHALWIVVTNTKEFLGIVWPSSMQLQLSEDYIAGILIQPIYIYIFFVLNSLYTPRSHPQTSLHCVFCQTQRLVPQPIGDH